MVLEAIKMKEEKDLFFFNKDEEKELGCIGYLRGDFGGGGKEFWTTWFPHNFPELNDEKFKVIFDAIINKMREPCGVLSDRDSMRAYCRTQPQCKVSHKRINAGYEIIKSFPVGNTEFVLGENIHDRARYVTWECTGGNNYFWGHYFTDKEAANKDLYDRVEAEVAFKRSIGEYPKENEPKKKTNRDREER